jgi:tripartite-type tricarboxylate transporter receptor subunit TctC
MKTLRMMTLGLMGTMSLGLAMATTGAVAQTYPNQVVRMVVPFSAGSSTDILARIVSEKLSEKWGQQVVVENRPGAPGTVGVGKSAPDGYTLMVTSNGHTVVGVLNKNLPVDPVKDFIGITQVATVPLVLISYPEMPVKSLKELIAAAKDKPGTLNFASPGLGSTTFIAAALFRQTAKIDVQHVPYKGAPEAVTSVIRGDSHFYFNPVNVGADLMQAGKVRALAVVSAKRNPTLPDVPTMAEAGLPEYSYDSWFGILAPAGTPKPIVDKVNKDVNDIMKMPDIVSKLEKQGIVPVTNTVDEFNKIIRDDTVRLGAVFKDLETAPKQ